MIYNFTIKLATNLPESEHFTEYLSLSNLGKLSEVSGLCFDVENDNGELLKVCMCFALGGRWFDEKNNLLLFADVVSDNRDEIIISKSLCMEIAKRVINAINEINKLEINTTEGNLRITNASDITETYIMDSLTGCEVYG